MKYQLIFLAILVILPFFVHSKGFGPGKQDYGFVTVRPGAHMFWWLYHTTANVTSPTERPLIIWLAGGPGSSSTGTGNFWFVGPLDDKMQPREENWVQYYNILFIDSPVGSGFSYVEDIELLNSDNLQSAEDLVGVTKGFYNDMPMFKDVPMFIYGISYGGKLATDYALMLNDEISNNNIDCNFKGVAMANPWISPMDSTMSYADLVFQMGYVDSVGKSFIEKQAKYTLDVFESAQYNKTKIEFVKTLELIINVTDGADIYNLKYKVKRDETKNFKDVFNEKISQRDDWGDFLFLYEFMNGPVKEALDIPEHVIWSSQIVEVQEYLDVDFIMPCTKSVEKLLNNTDIELHISSGNFDMMASTIGSHFWIDKLKWKDSQLYKDSPREVVWVDNIMEGYKKGGGRLFFYWINGGGHIAFEDNPAGNWAFLKSVTGM